jgi:predicted DNA-binding antitoxin AbrB/MazE fold protein
VNDPISFCREDSVIESKRKELKSMKIIVEAIYEAGVLKPLLPLSHLKENERVRLTVEHKKPSEDILQMIAHQRNKRIQIEPELAKEIGDSHAY